MLTWSGCVEGEDMLVLLEESLCCPELDLKTSFYICNAIILSIVRSSPRPASHRSNHCCIRCSYVTMNLRATSFGKPKELSTRTCCHMLLQLAVRIVASSDIDASSLIVLECEGAVGLRSSRSVIVASISVMAWLRHCGYLHRPASYTTSMKMTQGCRLDMDLTLDDVLMKVNRRAGLFDARRDNIDGHRLILCSCHR